MRPWAKAELVIREIKSNAGTIFRNKLFIIELANQNFTKSPT
jgi:hypothetical protein